MNLILRGYSLDVDFRNPQARESYLVFEKEGTGETIRVAVPEDTIVQLMSNAGVQLEDEPDEEPVADEPEEAQEEPEEEEEAPPPPPRQSAPPKKQIPQPPAPHVYASARKRITTEDDVPSV